MAMNSFDNNTGDQGRLDACLPPLPVPVSSDAAYRQEPVSQTESPITPFFDKNGPFYRSQTPDSLDSESQLYSAGGGIRAHDPGSFCDNIPLRPHPEPDLSEVDFFQTASPQHDKVLPVPARQRRRRKRPELEKRGLFQGRVPWVVYIFTLVQLTVFIVEMVKNGESAISGYMADR